MTEARRPGALYFSDRAPLHIPPRVAGKGSIPVPPPAGGAKRPLRVLPHSIPVVSASAGGAPLRIAADQPSGGKTGEDGDRPRRQNMVRGGRTIRAFV
jgi:hypothetical protein